MFHCWDDILREAFKRTVTVRGTGKHSNVRNVVRNVTRTGFTWRRNDLKRNIKTTIKHF